VPIDPAPSVITTGGGARIAAQAWPSAAKVYREGLEDGRAGLG